MQKWVSSFIYLLQMFGFFRYQAKANFIQSKAISENKFTDPCIVIDIKVDHCNFFVKHLGGFVIRWQSKGDRGIYHQFMERLLYQTKGITETQQHVIMTATFPVVVLFKLKKQKQQAMVEKLFPDLPKILREVAEDKRIVDLQSSVKLKDFMSKYDSFTLNDLPQKGSLPGRHHDLLVGIRRRMGLSDDQIKNIVLTANEILLIEDVFDVMEI